ncbi:MAG TPA: BTAD domain-containing putative transcriptional regulator, partial [Burkholderiaceae bacterium]|nr:BTAD domain-containing putative transcriptional regulator [Burkholderiaceae bacterium]
MSAPPLSLLLLGPPRVLCGEQEIALPTRKALALLAYVALNDAVVRPDLAALLWSNRPTEDARRNLRQELHRLNELPVGAWLDTRGDLVALRPGSDVDVHRLQRALAAGDLASAAPLVRGPFLQGLELKGAAGFMDWLTAQRELLARARRDAVRAWARAREAEGDAAAALAAARQLLDEDPLDEELAREVMRLLQLTGAPAAALALFEGLRARLRAELGAEPRAETIELARRLQVTPAPALRAQPYAEPPADAAPAA